MNLIFHKVTGLHPLMNIKLKDKAIKNASSSIEPSEKTTFGKLQQNLKNGLLQNNNIILNPQKNEKEKKFIQQEITKFPAINQLKLENKPNEIQKSRNKMIKNEKFYLSREIALTIEKYGRDLFSCTKENESRYLIPINFIDKHPCSPSVRERMVDWMVEVFCAYKCDPGIFELAVHIMDCFLSRTKEKIQDDDIHLIGLTSIYISSKVGDVAPLRMSHIVKNIGHNAFNSNTIINKEREIIKTIDFDLFTASTYDYIMTFFYDLKVNNAKRICELKGVKIIEKYLNFAIFLSQLLLYSHEFVCFRQSLNALAVLAFGFDILKTNIKDINQDLKEFLSDWVFYVINEMGFNSDTISIIYQKIYNLYYEKVILPQKSKKIKVKNDEDDIINLCKFNQDKFI